MVQCRSYKISNKYICNPTVAVKCVWFIETNSGGSSSGSVNKMLSLERWPRTAWTASLTELRMFLLVLTKTSPTLCNKVFLNCIKSVTKYRCYHFVLTLTICAERKLETLLLCLLCSWQCVPFIVTEDLWKYLHTKNGFSLWQQISY